MSFTHTNAILYEIAANNLSTCLFKLAKDCDRVLTRCEHLFDLASDQDTELLAGHGIMNRLPCSELRKSGWSIETKRGSGILVFNQPVPLNTHTALLFDL